MTRHDLKNRLAVSQSLAPQELTGAANGTSVDIKAYGGVLAVLDEVGAREHSQALTESAANRALDALAHITLPGWARAEAEELVDFLARREY